MGEIPEFYTTNFALERFGGEFLGKTIMAREICAYISPHWPNQRIKAVATTLAESHGRLGSYNDNYDDKGARISRDCGLFQNNIVARLVGTPTEASLRTESLDKAVWEPVVKSNVRWAYSLWSTKSVFRDDKLDYRRWQPWVAYTSGWATFNLLYAWHRDREGNPVGPWVPTGRYLPNAIRGVANWHLLTAKDMDKDEALEFARHQSYNVWGISETDCRWAYDSLRAVYYVPGPKPVQPPTEETNYGYPMKNDGR
jgi:hypothetical protein